MEATIRALQIGNTMISLKDTSEMEANVESLQRAVEQLQDQVAELEALVNPQQEETE